MKAFSILAVLLSFAWLSTDASAQAAASQNPVVIKSIEAGKTRTPEYQAKGVGPRKRPRQWFKIEVTYDTDAQWLDEVTFTYYVVVKAKEPIPGRNSLFTLFKGEVSYINIEKGRHSADIYLHPSTIARFGEVERVATVVSQGGRMVTMAGEPALSSGANARWWEQLPPQDGYLLNRTQTPFAMINFDDYEAIKPGKP